MSRNYDWDIVTPISLSLAYSSWAWPRCSLILSSLEHFRLWSCLWIEVTSIFSFLVISATRTSQVSFAVCLFSSNKYQGLWHWDYNLCLDQSFSSKVLHWQPVSALNKKTSLFLIFFTKTHNRHTACCKMGWWLSRVPDSQGSFVIGNIWHIHSNTSQKAQLLGQSMYRALANDEDMYQHPQKFWPDRFDGCFPMITDLQLFVYGFRIW